MEIVRPSGYRAEEGRCAATCAGRRQRTPPRRSEGLPFTLPAQISYEHQNPCRIASSPGPPSHQPPTRASSFGCATTGHRLSMSWARRWACPRTSSRSPSTSWSRLAWRMDRRWVAPIPAASGSTVSVPRRGSSLPSTWTSTSCGWRSATWAGTWSIVRMRPAPPPSSPACASTRSRMWCALALPTQGCRSRACWPSRSESRDTSIGTVVSDPHPSSPGGTGSISWANSPHDSAAPSICSTTEPWPA